MKKKRCKRLWLNVNFDFAFKNLKCMFFIPLLICGFSAPTQEIKMDLNLKNVSLIDVLHNIESNTKYSFIFKESDLIKYKNIDVDVEQESVENILKECLAETDLDYEVENNLIIIKKKFQQQTREITLRGKVVDKNNYALPGVTIVIKNTTYGVTTKVDGTFEIKLPAISDIELLVSFMGMKSQTIKYTGQETLNIVMEEDLQEIGEVVITGYQTIDKRRSTYSVSTVKADDMMIPGKSSIDQMLEGHIPDLTFVLNSGEVGVVPKIRIRGTSTLIGNREPVWVLDGVTLNDPVPLDADVLNDPDYVNRIGNAISGINPQDIDRIDVLKDAAATALYGYQAANGVIVVTTKKGHIGKPTITYQHFSSFKRRPRYSDRNIDLMNSKERVDLSRDLVAASYVFPSGMSNVGYEALISQLYSGDITDAEFKEKVARIETVNTDWFKILTEDVYSHQHTLSLSGGSNETRYYSSLGYIKDNDVIKGAELDKYTIALNLDSHINKWFDLRMKVNGNISTRKYNHSDVNAINYAYKTSRAIEAFDTTGDLSYYQKYQGSNSVYQYNIINEQKNSYQKQNSNGFSFNTNLIFNFTNYLDLNTLVSYAVANNNIEEFLGEKTFMASVLRESEYSTEVNSNSAFPYGSQLSKNDTKNETYTLRLQLNLNKYFGKDEQHLIISTLGYEMYSSKYKGYQSIERGYYPERGKQFISGIDAGTYSQYAQWRLNNVPKIIDNLTNTIGGYITAIYSYKYLFNINANARIDGSNRFGDRSNEKLLPIWSVSGSFNFNEIPSLNYTWLDLLSLKLSYGYQGNMLEGQSPVLIIQKGSMNADYNRFTSSVNTYANPELKWEKTQSFNAGLDFSGFNNKIQISSEFYYKHTSDAFMDKPVSTVNGLDSYVVNSGVVINKGFNISLTVSPIKRRDMQWTLSTFYSKAFNKLDTKPGNETYELYDFLNGKALVKDKPVSTFYSYKFAGLNPLDGMAMFDDYYDKAEKLIGLDKYETFTTVLKATGKREPSIAGNLNNTFRYKNFRLNMVIAYSLGAKVRLFRIFEQDNTGSASSVRYLYPEYNAKKILTKRWKVPGDENKTNIPAILGTNNLSYSQHYSQARFDGITFVNDVWEMYDYADIRVVSANYLKCTNLSLYYELPKVWIEKLFIQRCELSFSTSNLFTWSAKELKGQTPVQSNFSTVQLSERPTYTLGVNISF